MLESSAFRFVIIVGVAVAAHIATLVIHGASRRFLMPRPHSEAKVRTVTSFATSTLVFVIYFAAFGFVLSELGVPLTTYLASASVIDLAVNFGSQGVVQDVIMGLTVVLSDLLDVGDMVEIGGQVGLVDHVGMRFTILVNFTGARVYVPNRSIASVINHPKDHVDAFMDVRLPADSFLGTKTVTSGDTFMRINFRIWPGQGALLEQTLAGAVTRAMKALDPGIGDGIVTVHYRSQPEAASPGSKWTGPALLSKHFDWGHVPDARRRRTMTARVTESHSVGGHAVWRRSPRRCASFAVP